MDYESLQNDLETEWVYAILDPSLWNHLCDTENSLRSSTDYFGGVRQHNITTEIRAQWINWLVSLSDELKSHPGTLHLCVAFIDRYLSLKPVDTLDLLAVSSFFIAMKIEEGNSTPIRKICEMAENRVTEQEVRNMELEILKTLKYELDCPNAFTYLSLSMKFWEDSNKVVDTGYRTICYYLAELTLLDFVFIKFPMSLVASAVVFLSKFILWPEEKPWDLSLQNYSGYHSCELKDCVMLLHEIVLGYNDMCSDLFEVRAKYEESIGLKTLAIEVNIPVEYFT